MRLAELLLACLPSMPEREAAVILAEFDAVSYPSMSDGSTPKALAAFESAILSAAERQQALALELSHDHRDHPRLAEVLRLRWTLFSTVQRDGDTVVRETDEWLAQSPEPAVVAAAAATRALAAIRDPDFLLEQRVALVRAALQSAPSEPLVGDALMELARDHATEPAQQRELATLARHHFGDQTHLARDLAELERLVASVGRPLALSFAGDAADASIAAAPRGLAEWRGRPCLVHAPFVASGWIGPEESAERTLFASLRERHPAPALPCLTVVTLYDDTAAAPLFAELAERGFEPPTWLARATFERSWLRDQVGIDRPGLWLLLDRDGVLRGWSFRLAALQPAIDALLAAQKPKKRRAI